MKAALIVEGGGMRGVFASGVLHAFGKLGFDPFDLYFGVSAGACSLASHLAGQNNRNYEIMERWSANRRAINPWRFLRGGHYIDLDWLWDMTIQHDRLDLDALFQKAPDFYIVATSLISGKPLYLRPAPDNLEHYLKVSSALPVVYRGKLSIGGEPMTDGGVGDAIPVLESWRRGANRMIVVRSRKPGYVKKAGLQDQLMAWAYRHREGFSAAIRTRADRYNEALRFISDPPPGVQVIDVTPPEDFQTGRTTTNLEILRQDYERGVAAGYEAARAFSALTDGITTGPE